MPKFYEIPADYKGLLPEFLQDFLEIELLDEIINPQIDETNSRIHRTVDNKTVEYSDEAGITRWEKILALNSPIGSSLEQRKNAVKAKLMTRAPINLGTLRRIVETYLGVPVDIILWWNEEERTWGEIKQDFSRWGKILKFKWGDFCRATEPYVVTIYYRGTSTIPDLRPLYQTIYAAIPANLVVKILYKYQTWGEVKETHKSWKELCSNTAVKNFYRRFFSHL